MGERVRDALPLRHDTEDAHRPCDVLELLLADVFEGQVEAPHRVLPHPRRNANPARLGQSFEACRDIDAIAKNVAILDNDVSLMNADPKLGLAAAGHWFQP
jgi:hypothetical protein